MDRAESKNIASVPIQTFVNEGISQSRRRAEEVMMKLFEALPAEVGRSSPDFVLADGTECWVKKFHPPRANEKDGMTYGFDVVFSPGSPLVHLEFSVRCSGWERAL